MINCKYCEIIHSIDNSYPINLAVIDIDTDFPRCSLHGRYRCEICKTERHFSSIAWDKELKKYICIYCAKSVRIVPVKFWCFDYYFELEVGKNKCYSLDWKEYLEFYNYSGCDNMLDHDNKMFTSPIIEGFTESPVINAFSEQDVANRWNINAQTWDDSFTEDGDPRRKSLIGVQQIIDLFQGVQGKKILDAGCGNGYLCRSLAKSGACVVGLDIASSFIEKNRKAEKENKLCIEYIQGSVTKMDMFQDNYFDCVVSNTVLINVPNYRAAISEMVRVLNPGGKLLLILVHPCFSAPGFESVKKVKDSDRSEDILFWKVDNYFDRSSREVRYRELNVPLINFHRTLSDYINVIIRSGIKISYFDEPSPPLKDILNNPTTLAAKGHRIPRFIIILGTK